MLHKRKTCPTHVFQLLQHQHQQHRTLKMQRVQNYVCPLININLYNQFDSLGSGEEERVEVESGEEDRREVESREEKEERGKRRAER